MPDCLAFPLIASSTRHSCSTLGKTSSLLPVRALCYSGQTRASQHKHESTTTVQSVSALVQTHLRKHKDGSDAKAVADRKVGNTAPRPTCAAKTSPPDQPSFCNFLKVLWIFLRFQFLNFFGRFKFLNFFSFSKIFHLFFNFFQGFLNFFFSMNHPIVLLPRPRKSASKGASVTKQSQVSHLQG